MNRYTKIIATMAVGLSAITALAAVNADGTNSPMQHHHMMPRSPFMMAIHQLDLSDAQRQSIHSIMESSHSQEKEAFTNRKNEFSALMNPGDPNFGTAVKAAEAAAVAGIEQRSQIATQIYNLLTPDQQKKLPEVLANMKDHMQHHAQWHQSGEPTKNAPVN
jgi:Spy/CpxP family protein refolding chaperone